jgi:hypothetical protein
LVDVLPPRFGLLCGVPLRGRFYCRHSCRSSVLRAVALSLYLFCCFCVYSRLLTTILVVCNLRYEGSLIADL